MAHLVEDGDTFCELVRQEQALGFQGQDMQAVASQTTFDLFFGTNSFQYLPHGVLRGTVASEFQVSKHSLILTLLEVCEQEQVRGDAPELIFITKLD